VAATTSTTPRLAAVGSLPGPVADLVLAAGTLVVTLTQLAHGGIGPLQTTPDRDLDASWGLDARGVALAAAASLPLLLRRRHPAAAFAVTATASVALAALAYRLDLVVGAAVALYFLSANRASREPVTGRPHQQRRLRPTVPIGVAVATAFVAYVGAIALARDVLPGSAVLHTGLAWSVAWVAGERSRLREAHLADLRARAGRAERDAQRDRQLAAAEERARIARDLHDSAGHAVTVIAVRAGAARLRHGEDPDRSRTALEAIEELARETGEEIDRIVGNLRTDDPAGGARPGSGAGPVPPPPGLASITTLVDRHRAAGHVVAVTRSGTPQPLSPTVDQAAYRIVQEALTNAVRHGAGPVDVALRFDDDSLGIAVTNPVEGTDAGVGATGDHGVDGGGHGLVGMRERAALVGGDLTADRRDSRFRLDVRLPAPATTR
jgi:signal transduction histidine kinase